MLGYKFDCIDLNCDSIFSRNQSCQLSWRLLDHRQGPSNRILRLRWLSRAQGAQPSNLLMLGMRSSMSMNKRDVIKKVHEEHCYVLVSVAFNGHNRTWHSIAGLLLYRSVITRVVLRVKLLACQSTQMQYYRAPRGARCATQSTLLVCGSTLWFVRIATLST